MSDTFYTLVSEDYPLEDVFAIEQELSKYGALVPGYEPPPVGLLDISGFAFARQIEGILSFTILPDRNLASRMARVSRFGVEDKESLPLRIAVLLMAFAHATELDFEPSIAFHELAHTQGNSLAHEELAWFRAGNRGDFQSWIDVAMGRRNAPKIGPIPPSGEEDLAFPLRRWNRNYIVALKVAELELANMTPLERALSLFKWMHDDFILAGPAAVFSTMYFSPQASKRRVIKHLRSPDRQRAIDGLKNATWDMTHLSDFVHKVQYATDEKRYIFATADQSLAKIDPLLLLTGTPITGQGSLANALGAWWSVAEAREIAEALSYFIQDTKAAEKPPRRSWSTNDITRMILCGEELVRNWKPATHSK